MPKSIGRTVTHAKLHETVFIHGAGDLGKVFPASEKTINDLKMTTSELGLLIAGIRNGFKFEALAPWPIVIQATLVHGEGDDVKTNSTSNKAK